MTTKVPQTMTGVPDRAAGAGIALLDTFIHAPGVRQVVLAGPLSSGVPGFLPSTAVALSITSTGVSSTAPFIVAAAGGFGASSNRVAVQTTNLTWSGLTASNTNYLYVDVAADGVLTTGATVTAPSYVANETYSTTSGQWTFSITEMTGKLGNGSTAAQVWRVFVGEAVCDGTGVTSTVAYAYAGRYLYTDSGNYPTGLVSKNHNLGVSLLVTARVQLVCTTGEAGYSTGDVVDASVQESGTVYGPLMPTIRAKTVSWNTSLTSRLFNLSTGGVINLTAANWRYRIIVQRGW